MAKKIAVFASGNGSNFQVIAEQFPVEFVFSDHRNAYVLERAKNLNVVSHAFELKEFDNKATYEEAIVKLLDDHQIDLVCLAGYMKIVGPTLLAAYEGRIINIHPAYLPEFPGAHGIEDAWNAGVNQSGVTIHWVDSGVEGCIFGESAERQMAAWRENQRTPVGEQFFDLVVGKGAVRF